MQLYLCCAFRASSFWEIRDKIRKHAWELVEAWLEAGYLSWFALAFFSGPHAGQGSAEKQLRIAILLASPGAKWPYVSTFTTAGAAQKMIA